MVYDDIKISYITIEHLFCKSDDLSTAYKVVIRHKGNLNTSDIKKIIIDINTLQVIYRALISKYGMNEGLNVYRKIKDLL